MRSVRVNVAFKKAEDAVFFKLSWGMSPSHVVTQTCN
jgi:hypothetical protein